MSKKSLQDIIKEKKGNLSDNEKQQMKGIGEKAEQYTNMSKDQLLAEIIKNKTSSNSVDNKSLNEFEKYISPMLDDKQKKQLKSIMKQLKN